MAGPGESGQQIIMLIFVRYRSAADRQCYVVQFPANKNRQHHFIICSDASLRYAATLIRQSAVPPISVKMPTAESQHAWT